MGQARDTIGELAIDLREHAPSGVWLGGRMRCEADGFGSSE